MAVTFMEFAQFAPPPALAGVVKLIWLARGPATPDVFGAPIVPDGCPEILVNAGDAFERFVDGAVVERQPRVLVAGQVTAAVDARPTGTVDIVGLRCWPGRAGHLLGVPMHELQDRFERLDALLGRTADLLLEAMQGTSVPAARIARLGQVLGRRCASRPVRRSPVADQVIDAIERCGGRVAIGALARSHGVSRRSLERGFAEHVGIAPKVYSRIVRIQRALRILDAVPDATGADVAAACGYADQAHLVREFKEIAGHTPGRLAMTHRTFASALRTRRVIDAGDADSSKTPTGFARQSART